MLFNSGVFIFLFLPLAVSGYYLLSARSGGRAAMAWLVVCSLFFYGYWNPKYLALIGLSVAVNFAVGRWLEVLVDEGCVGRAGWALALGVIFNLALLGYFKYAGFFAATVNDLTGTRLPIPEIVLPLAISFFTFQQIAYLVDVHRGIVRRCGLLQYLLFVTFFPQLIAGPIVHHSEMLPQFTRRTHAWLSHEDIAAGVTIFFIGLFKKVVLADGVARYSSPLFDAATAGEALSLLSAWGAALGYTMQLYFDFSGYCDMAIGAARLFGIHLPVNFDSPYKARSIAEFWRRWHITLSRFLRDYLYIPLGGGRCRPARRYLNLAITMLLGGLWHGAGWTFVFWGALHGAYLAMHRVWTDYVPGKVHRRLGASRIWQPVAWTLTFVAVVVGWVYFRASSLEAANSIVAGMAGLHGVSLPSGVMARLGEIGTTLAALGVSADESSGSRLLTLWLWIAALIPVVLFAPNTQQLMGEFNRALATYENPARPAADGLGRLGTWQPTPAWAVVVAAVSGLGVLSLTRVSEFLYFQF